MTVKVGTWRWLLRHELRVMSRESRHYVSRKPMLWTLLLLQVAVGLVAGFFAWELSKHPVPVRQVIGSPLALIYFMLLAGFLFSSAIKAVVVALFDGGDIELLLSSPVSSRTIFIVRLLRVAASSGLLIAVFVLPAVNVAACMGQLRLLAIYPLLASLLLTFASAALLLALALVRWVGARKAKAIAQFTAVLCGSIIFIGCELPSMLDKADAHRVWMWIQHSMAPDGWLGYHSLLRYPLWAAWGQPLPLLICIGVAATATAGAICYLGHQFREGLLLAQSDPGSGGKGSGKVSFNRSLGRNLLVKEWRLIYRDPFIISRLLRQVLFMIPGIWILLFKWHHSLAVYYWMLGGVVLFTVCSLVMELSWMTVCGEDTTLLLGCAPIASERVKLFKVLAALLPLWMVCLPIVVMMTYHDAYMGASFGVTLFLSTWSLAVLTVWMPRPGNRPEFEKRRRGIRPDARRTIPGLALTVGCGLGYYFLAQHSAWACLALAAAVGTGEAARVLGPRLEKQLAY